MMKKSVIIGILILILTGCTSGKAVREPKTQTDAKQETTEETEAAEINVTIVPQTWAAEEEISLTAQASSLETAEQKSETKDEKKEPTTADFYAALEKMLDPGYILENSDSEYLTESDISSFSREKLRFARNEIYARHGKVFEDKYLQSFFYTRAWYRGDENAEIGLNEYELRNCELIQKREDELEHHEAENLETDGWVILEEKNGKYRFQDMEVDLTGAYIDEYTMFHYPVIYRNKKFEFKSLLQYISRMAARIADDGNIMIRISGEDDADCTYTEGFVVSTGGIKSSPGVGTSLYGCVGDYVCCYHTEYYFYDIPIYTWQRIDGSGEFTRCLGGYDASGLTLTIKIPLEVNTLKNEQKETLQVGEKISPVCRLWNEGEDFFLVLRRESTGEKVWIWFEEFISDCKDGISLSNHFEEDFITVGERVYFRH